MHIDWSSQQGSSGLLLCVSRDLPSQGGEFYLETQGEEASGLLCHGTAFIRNLGCKGYTRPRPLVGQLSSSRSSNDRARERLIEGYGAGFTIPGKSAAALEAAPASQGGAALDLKSRHHGTL